jgi:glutaredoxin
MSLILWGASWCAPCGPLKEFVKTHYPHVRVMDISDERAKHLQIKSVPALQVGTRFITGVNEIKMHLARREDE